MNPLESAVTSPGAWNAIIRFGLQSVGMSGPGEVRGKPGRFSVPTLCPQA
jgi:hypothetical protein